MTIAVAGGTALPDAGLGDARGLPFAGLKVIDLKRPAGQALLHRLVAQADVFISILPLPARARLGIAAEQLLPLNPRLVYASMTVYGETGPEAHKTGFDVTAYWARSGLMDLVRSDAEAPHALNNIYRTRCGRWLNRVVLNTRQLRPLLQALDLAALADDPRLASEAARSAQHAELIARFDARFAEHDLPKWRWPDRGRPDPPGGCGPAPTRPSARPAPAAAP